MPGKEAVIRTLLEAGTDMAAVSTMLGCRFREVAEVKRQIDAEAAEKVEAKAATALGEIPPDEICCMTAEIKRHNESREASNDPLAWRKRPRCHDCPRREREPVTVDRPPLPRQWGFTLDEE